MKHKCFENVNEHLAKFNTQLDINLLNTNQVFVSTLKVDSKKRVKPRTVIATYCPFCGKVLK